MLTKILNLVERIRKYETLWVEDLPDYPKKDTVYIVGGRKYPFYAAVACPRKKCQKVIHLGISPRMKTKWRVTEHENGTISLFPSVAVTDSPCGCHYWFRKGHIVWCDMPSLFVPEENIGKRTAQP